MTKLQEQMLNKIALNRHSAINGQEPTHFTDTYTLEYFVLESNIDRPVFNSLLKYEWVFIDNGLVGLTETGFKVFEEL